MSLLAFVALVHCGEDEPTPIECTITNLGKGCECKLGVEPLGFCSEQVLGIPSVCCAQDGWPASNLRCTCDLIVCVALPGVCKCSRASQRLEGAGAEEVAVCPAKNDEKNHCCVDKAGNCGCYDRVADECGEGATDIDTCDYFKAQPPCNAGEHATKTCEE